MSPKKNDLMGKDALNLLNEVIFGQKRSKKQKVKQTLFPILPPQIHKFPDQNYEIEYVTGQQIKDFHDEDFCKKFDKEIYGSTCMMIEKGDEQILAIYYEDYERFARKILLGTPTYWD